jgi:hypothetical protein
VLLHHDELDVGGVEVLRVVERPGSVTELQLESRQTLPEALVVVVQERQSFDGGVTAREEVLAVANELVL